MRLTVQWPQYEELLPTSLVCNRPALAAGSEVLFLPNDLYDLLTETKMASLSFHKNTKQLNTHTRTPVRRPFVQDYPGEPVPER